MAKIIEIKDIMIAAHSFKNFLKIVNEFIFSNPLIVIEHLYNGFSMEIKFFWLSFCKSVPTFDWSRRRSSVING